MLLLFEVDVQTLWNSSFLLILIKRTTLGVVSCVYESTKTPLSNYSILILNLDENNVLTNENINWTGAENMQNTALELRWRITSEWNSLSQDLREVMSLPRFKIQS